MEAETPNVQGDISNKTIVVLVILTVLISILSTLVVLNEVSSMNAPQKEKIDGSTSTTAKVSVEILPRPVQSTGMVTLSIKPKENDLRRK